MQKMPLIIAEAGVNHNGSQERALELIDIAADAGADIVKFQSFTAKTLASENAPKASYQKKTTDTAESQYDMLAKLEMSHSMHLALIAHCKEKGIEFLSTPFDVSNLHYLLDLNIGRIKLPSGEIHNVPLLETSAKSGLPIILSTGMCNLADIESSLGVIAFSLAGESNKQASLQAYKEALSDKAVWDTLKERVTLLHCTTQYPTPLEGVNLNAMVTMRNAFGLSVGYSDHTEGVTVPIAATAFGAEVIEKHFTLDKNLPGPDHKASLDPNELKAMVKGINDAATSLGNGRKAPALSEVENLAVVRKSLHAARDIQVGDTFTEDNLTLKRPGTGMSPLKYRDLIGTLAKRTYKTGEIIC